MRRSFAEQHPILLGFALFFGVVFVVAFWPIFVAAAVYVAAWYVGRELHRAGLRRRAERDAIIARADYEHGALMRGDAWRGTFGRYQPAPWWRA